MYYFGFMLPFTLSLNSKQKSHYRVTQISRSQPVVTRSQGLMGHLIYLAIKSITNNQGGAIGGAREAVCERA